MWFEIYEPTTTKSKVKKFIKLFKVKRSRRHDFENIRNLLDTF